MTLINVHNEKLDAAHRHCVIRFALAEAADTASETAGLVLCGGDFNFPPPGEDATHILSDGTVRQNGRIGE